MITELAKRSMYELPRITEGPREDRFEILPAVDVFEDEESYMLYFEVPGANSSTVSAEISNGVLSVRAKSSLIRRGHPLLFHREFQLSREIDVEKIQAKTADGVLTLILPKSTSARVHRIPVA